MTHDRLTVAVVTHDGQADVPACLSSLIESGVPASRVLVIDNASRDGTPDMIASRFPAVRVVRMPRNEGYGGAANVAVVESTGEYLAIVNQDVVFRMGWAQYLVDALDADPSAGLATPKILLLDDPERINAC